MKNTDFTAFLYFLAASVRQLNLLSRHKIYLIFLFASKS